MQQREITIKTKDGYDLSATLREPNGSRRGIVQINSGGVLSQEVYTDFASFLTDRGFVTVTYDYRGVGRSKPLSWRNFDTTLHEWGSLDMAGVFDWVIKNYSDERKIMIGHSFGGDLVGMMENNDKIEKLFFIGSSTKYRKDLSSPYTWLLPIAFTLISLYAPLYYHFRSLRKFFIPAGVALEWRRWCSEPNFFEAEFGRTLRDLYFEQIKIPLKALYFTDDPYANDVTVQKLMKFYKNAEISIERISPEDVGQAKIGHSGFFRKEFKNTLWVKFLEDMG